MYLKQHKVGEDNPKESGNQFTDEGNMFFHITNGWIVGSNQNRPDFWYSEVTERLYTEEEIVQKLLPIKQEVEKESCTQLDAIWYIDQFISQLNKDKDK